MTTAGIVERLFRQSTGPILATLTRALGPERLDLAEDCLADALELALRVWPGSGVPANPRGWLFQVARNRALDVVRRERTLRAKLPLLTEDAAEADDGELALMFLCCHPALPRASQVALTLKIVGGLGVREIATALLAKESAVAQRLVRAKKWFRESGEAVEVPDAPEARLDGVLDVLYLLFSEGYQATTGDLVVRRELCAEAIRLTRLLAADTRTARPRVGALLALQLLQASRLAARDELLPIGEQDRTRWDTALVREGAQLFERSCTGPELSAFHVEAAIALCHTGDAGPPADPGTVRRPAGPSADGGRAAQPGDRARRGRRAAGRDRRAGTAGRRTRRAPAAARRARGVVPAGRRRRRGCAPLPARAGLAGFGATTDVPGTAAGRVRVTPGWLVP